LNSCQIDLGHGECGRQESRRWYADIVRGFVHGVLLLGLCIYVPGVCDEARNPFRKLCIIYLTQTTNPTSFSLCGVAFDVLVALLIGKASVQSFYQPFLVVVNGTYIALRSWWMGWSDLGVRLVLILSLLGGLQWYAYQGIVHAATTQASRKANSTSLVGGSHLDLLGLALFVQFGAVLISPKLYHVLWFIPIWGGYTAYRTWMAPPIGRH
jgi:hypothetical protein